MGRPPPPPLVRDHPDLRLRRAADDPRREATMAIVRAHPFAPASAVLFVFGFFALATRGLAASAGVYATILVGAAILASIVFVFAAALAAVESVTGRAWALGFRRLAPGELGAGGIAQRALKYATFLWLCNGTAFVVAGVI
jgi:hypothetical protein